MYSQIAGAINPNPFDFTKPGSLGAEISGTAVWYESGRLYFDSPAAGTSTWSGSRRPAHSGDTRDDTSTTFNLDGMGDEPGRVERKAPRRSIADVTFLVGKKNTPPVSDREPGLREEPGDLITRTIPAAQSRSRHPGAR